MIIYVYVYVDVDVDICICICMCIGIGIVFYFNQNKGDFFTKNEGTSQKPLSQWVHDEPVVFRNQLGKVLAPMKQGWLPHFPPWLFLCIHLRFGPLGSGGPWGPVWWSFWCARFRRWRGRSKGNHGSQGSRETEATRGPRCGGSARPVSGGTVQPDCAQYQLLARQSHVEDPCHPQLQARVDKCVESGPVSNVHCNPSFGVLVKASAFWELSSLAEITFSKPWPVGDSLPFSPNTSAWKKVLF